jgi:hypothetical protein
MTRALDPTERALLRHMLATLAYRGGKVIRNAPPGFGAFRAEGVLNTPVVLLAHVNDLLEWAHRWSRGEPDFRISKPQEWDVEAARFHESLGHFDRFLESGEEVGVPLETLFQAPIADALTHIGQLALLRRMAGGPVLGESYRFAEIVIGRVGAEQAAPVREFAPDKGAIYRERRE